MEWIYDRTQADVDRVSLLNQKYATGAISEEEKKEWDAGSIECSRSEPDRREYPRDCRSTGGKRGNKNVGKRTDPSSK